MPDNSNDINAPEQGLEVRQELDATGLYCPEPVMMLHNKIRDIAPGALLRLTATDPSTTRDIPKFCHYLGHELLESDKRGNEYHYLIKKKPD